LFRSFAGLLGERLQYVVVEDQERGLALLDGLKGRGRGHVIPQNPPHLTELLSVEGPGALGLLADKLSYRPADAGLVRALVGSAVLVESPELALSYVKLNSGATAVALDGTVVRPDGVISGGNGDDVAAAMVEQKREMHQLGTDIT